MHYTSAEAAKLLRQLKEKEENLLGMEKRSREFRAALGENVDSVRPPYDYAAIQQELHEMNCKIRIVKHAINQFNVEHEVPGFGMTIDQMLIYIPYLNSQKDKLRRMADRLPKQREKVSGIVHSSVIDYNYANYDISVVQEDYKRVSNELSRAQTALDVINNTELMEIDL